MNIAPMRQPHRKRTGFFAVAVGALILFAVIRSAIATRLDSSACAAGGRNCRAVGAADGSRCHVIVRRCAAAAPSLARITGVGSARARLIILQHLPRFLRHPLPNGRRLDDAHVIAPT